MFKPITLAALIVATATGAHASSGNAWAEFAIEVEQSCIAAASDYFAAATAIVDPFGSESYGMAIVTGKTSVGTTASLICVFNKQTKAVEIGGELNITVTSQDEAD